MPPQSRYRARPRDRRQAMRSLTSLHESRVYSPENFWSPVQKDFCNNICQSRPSALQQKASLFDHLVGAGEGLDGRAICSDISSNATAILRVGLAVMPAQIFFFAQDLTVEQPCGRDQINQTYPIWEDEEFSNQDNRKGHINGIATESENAVGYESVGMVSVNAHSKALPKGNQAPQEQQQPRQAKQHSDPRDYLGMEKLVRRHSRPVEGRGEQDIEIEQGKWRDQEIRLVHITEFHRFYALSSQDRDSGQYHPKQHDDCQCSEIFWHQNSPLLHPDIQCSPVTRTKQLRRLHD